MPTTRIYVVVTGDEKRLIDATSSAQAIRHCVRNRYSAKPATPKEIAAFMRGGISVEQAADDSALIPTQTQSAQAQQTSHT